MTIVQVQETRKRTYRPRPGEEHEERARSVPYSEATRSADHHQVQKASPTKSMEVDTMIDGIVVGRLLYSSRLAWGRRGCFRYAFRLFPSYLKQPSTCSLQLRMARNGVYG